MKRLFLLLVFIMTVFLGISQNFDHQGAGVTIIVHGWDPDGKQPDWMTSMAEAIIERSGNDGQIDTITVTGTTGNLTVTRGRWDFDMPNATSGQIVILINWTAVADHLTTNVTAQEVAAAVTPVIYEEYNGQKALSQLPIHLIGHSRGGGMIYEIARLLGLKGIEVEQLTSLDPHPLTEDDPQPATGTPIIDTPIKVYENILFVDNYYQEIEEPTGEYVEGAFNRLWTSLPGGYHNESGYTYTIGTKTYDFSDHLNIILMYHGTIDLSTPCSNTEATMTETERTDWFNTYENEGANEGFYYSSDIRGNRKSTDTPVAGSDQIIDGYHNDTLLGGNGAREDLDWTDAVWGNIITFDVYKNGTLLEPGAQTVHNGDEIEFRCNYRSYADSAALNFYMDNDRNPYTNSSDAIASLTIPATSSDIIQKSVFWTVDGLSIGSKFYIFGQAETDLQYLRYLYSAHEFTVQDYSDDLAVVAIEKPVKDFSDNMPVTISIVNKGTDSQSNFNVSYTFNGNKITETCTESVAQSDTIKYTFAQKINLSEEGNYDISAKTELENDENTDNDEYSTKINTYVNDNAIYAIDGDYISIANNDLLNFTGDFTLETWFYADSTTSTQDIISKHADDGVNKSGYAIEYDGTNITGIIGTGDSWTKVEGSVSSNEWHHVALVFYNSKPSIYLDGEILSYTDEEISMDNNTKDLYICASQQYDNFFTGYIDETRIWNKARTQQEIKDNMKIEIDSNSANLVAYYNYNRGIPEGDNTAIEYLPDMTNNNLHGKLQNFTLAEGSSEHNFFSTCDLDLLEPVPDLDELPDITAECEVSSLTEPTATDNCAGSIKGTSDVTFPITRQGITVVTWTYDDGNGHSVSQTQNVIIEDNTAPELSCISDTTVVANENDGYTINNTDFDVTASDNCEIDSVSNDFNNSSTLKGAKLPEGENTITWTAIDKNGNQSQCVCNITVDKTTAVIPKPGNNIIESYPNPTPESLTVKVPFSGVYEIMLMDNAGKIMIDRYENISTLNIDLSKYKPGIFYLKIIYEGKTYLQKIMKQ